MTERDPEKPAPIVELDGVTRRFGDHVAVDDVTLRIEEGEFFSLLGPSGSGKTTILRLIAGFEPADSGRVTIGGEDCSRLPPERRPVNTVFQSYALFPTLSVFGNVAYGLRVARVPKAEIRERVAEALALVQLDGFDTRKVTELSGGQAQRVALARTLVMRPRVLLLDEPLGALDLKLRREMQLELTRIQRSLGITFVFVTHDQEEALTMSDRIAVMRDGRIAQLDAPHAVYSRPSSGYVARFVGETNLLAPAEIAWLSERADAAVALPGGPASLRPELVRVGAAASALPITFPGVVRHAAFRGAVHRYEVLADDGGPLLIVTTSGGEHEPLGPGDRVAVGVAINDLVEVPDA